MPITSTDYANPSWLEWLEENHPMLVPLAKSKKLSDEAKDEVLAPARAAYNRFAEEDQATIRSATAGADDAANTVPAAAPAPKFVRMAPRVQIPRSALRTPSAKRSQPYDGPAEVATKQLEGSMLVTAMQTLWRTTYPGQELPNDENLKLFWDAACEDDRQQCAALVVQLQQNKKHVSYAEKVTGGSVPINVEETPKDAEMENSRKGSTVPAPKTPENLSDPKKGKGDDISQFD